MEIRRSWEQVDVDADQCQHARSIVDRLLTQTALAGGLPIVCPYLPDRTARSEGFRLSKVMEGDFYRALMDRGFRRSGAVFYRPACDSCRQCIPIRVPVATFRPSRSMRRVWRKNADVEVDFGDGVPTDEKYALFKRYLDEHHDGTMSGDREEFADFLYCPPVPGAELCYYLGKRLVGVSLIDVVPDAISSVYMFFDPAEVKRSLGTFSILWEIEHCRSRRIAYYYLGYWVSGSKTMAYKARFAPAEIRAPTGEWVRLQQSEAH